MRLHLVTFWIQGRGISGSCRLVSNRLHRPSHVTARRHAPLTQCALRVCFFARLPPSPAAVPCKSTAAEHNRCRRRRLRRAQGRNHRDAGLGFDPGRICRVHRRRRRRRSPHRRAECDEYVCDERHMFTRPLTQQQMRAPSAWCSAQLAAGRNATPQRPHPALRHHLHLRAVTPNPLFPRWRSEAQQRQLGGFDTTNRVRGVG